MITLASEGAYLPCPRSPGLCLVLHVVTTKQPAQLFLRFVVFSPVRGETAEGCEVHAQLPPLSGAKEEGGERQGGPSPRWGRSVYSQAACWGCTSLIALKPPQVVVIFPSSGGENGS